MSAIATPERRATAAGEDVLAAGGTAADAVIAAAAVLCVVYPQMVTIGGDTWTLVGDDSAVFAVNGTGRTPAAITPEIVRAAGHDAMPSVGVHSISVPGLLDAWGTMHARWGRTPWAELLAPAISLAAEGAIVAPSLARDRAAYADRLALDPGCHAVFTAGTSVVQPALADSLRQLAAEGGRAFYDGDLGARFVAGLAEHGGTMTVADLAAHHTELVDPLGSGWRGLEVLTAPPTSQGFTLQRMLQLMDERGVIDPLDPTQAMDFAQLQALAGSERDRVWSGRPPRLDGDTIGMVAADDHGLVISSVQSVAGTFGSLLLDRTDATTIDGLDNRFGHAHALWWEAGILSVGTEPRADGLPDPTPR